MIYEHFRATDAHDAALDLSDLFNSSFQGDDIQDFDTRCDQSASEVSKENVLESLYKMKIRRVCSASDCIINWTRNWSRPSNAKLSKIENYEQKTHWSNHQDAQIQSPEWKGLRQEYSSRVRQGRMWVLKGGTGECYQWKAKWTVFKRRLLQFELRE